MTGRDVPPPYCNRCGIPHTTPCLRPGGPMTDPKTVAEQFDAAADGQEFMAVLQNLFRGLEKAKDDE